mgnify:CR=1 FL=1
MFLSISFRATKHRLGFPCAGLFTTLLQHKLLEAPTDTLITMEMFTGPNEGQRSSRARWASSSGVTMATTWPGCHHRRYPLFTNACAGCEPLAPTQYTGGSAPSSKLSWAAADAWQTVCLPYYLKGNQHGASEPPHVQLHAHARGPLARRSEMRGAAWWF